VNRPGSLNDLPAFEKTLRVRIAVIAASLDNTFIRVPANNHEDWPLFYLYLMDHEGVSHFHAIVNITGFLPLVTFVSVVLSSLTTRRNTAARRLA